MQASPRGRHFPPRPPGRHCSVSEAIHLKKDEKHREATTMLVTSLGFISLNISFFLYFFVFVPQIFHNRHTQHIANLSLTLHFLLFFTYLLDLFYGFAYSLQWQYKTVSCVCLFLIFIQHGQLVRFQFQHQQYKLVIANISLFIISIFSLFYFFIFLHHTLSTTQTASIGYISRVSYVIYSTPQILKNFKLKSTNAINLTFIYLNIILTLLDTLSAWCLDWGWPNKLAAPVMTGMMLVLLLQTHFYSENTMRQPSLA